MIKRFKKFLHTKQSTIKFILLLGLLAILGHGYVIYRYFKDGVIFTGPNDGIEQMLPIQMFLYEHWTKGSFFYTTDLGLGGDMLTDFAYYFSTNILFIINVIVILISSFIFNFDTDRMLFWHKTLLYYLL